MVTTRPQTLHFLSLFITYILQNKGHIILKLITYPTPRMANLKILNLLLLFFIFICAAQITQGSRTNIIKPYPQSTHHPSAAGEKELQVHGIRDNARRLMIGSVAPTCTYNECRGCKYRCRAEQVPVEGNDPMNSAYHYKCICHR